MAGTNARGRSGARLRIISSCLVVLSLLAALQAPVSASSDAEAAERPAPPNAPVDLAGVIESELAEEPPSVAAGAIEDDLAPKEPSVPSPETPQRESADAAYPPPSGSLSVEPPHSEVEGPPPASSPPHTASDGSEGSARLEVRQGRAGTGSITGTVLDTSESPVVGVWVVAESDHWYDEVLTGSDGSYTVPGLPADSYWVSFHPQPPLAPQYYDGASIGADATMVAVGPGEEVVGVDATLELGGSISGVVTDGGGLPLSGVDVIVTSSNWYRSTTTAGDGSYNIDGLAIDQHRVYFDPSWSHAELQSQYYDGVATWSEATLVSVGPGVDVVGIDAALVRGGSISGVVTDGGSVPLEGVEVMVTDGDGFWDYAYTAADGSYTRQGLPPGDYRVYFDPWWSHAELQSQYYDGVATWSEATLVSVGPGVDVVGIDAALQQGGSISGVVTDGSGVPLEYVDVQVSDGDGYSRWAYTASDGSYSFQGLPPGDYRVYFDPWWSHAELQSQYYDGVATWSEATLVSVGPGADVVGIDAVLVEGAAISGVVTDSVGTPLAGVVVTAQGDDWASTTTDSDGSYMLRPSIDGDYRVYFDPSTAHPHLVAEFYSGAASWHAATLVTMSGGVDVTGIDAALAPGGSISGTVTGPGGVPVEGVFVRADPYHHWDGVGREVLTGADGSYQITGLAVGEYRVRFGVSTGPYLGQYWSGADWSDATPVMVDLGVDTGGIDAELQLGASVTGVVTGPDGAPLAGVHIGGFVCSKGFIGMCVSTGPWTTAADGSYLIEGLDPAAIYSLSFNTHNWWGDLPFPHLTQPRLNIDDLELGVTSVVDVQLEVGGVIRGTVTDEMGTPVSGVDINLLDGPSYRSDSSAADGTFEFLGLSEGSYTVRFDPRWSGRPDLTPQYYDGVATKAAATAIEVELGVEYDGIDAQLVMGGAIEGVVTDPEGVSLPDTTVYVLGLDGEPGTWVETDVDGTYRADGLGSGHYTVVAYPPAGREDLLGTYHGGVTDAAWATPVLVELGSTTGEVDVTLLAGSSISGIVTDPEGAAVAGAEVWAGGPSGYGSVVTQADGSYTIEGLASGSYRVQFVPPEGSDLASQYWSASPTWWAAQQVIVGDSAVLGIDAQLWAEGDEPPVDTGWMRVTTSPALPSQISVDGVTMNGWGLDWVSVPVGTREVCFSEVPGFITPACETVTVQAGVTTVVDGAFSPSGLLRVDVEPAGLPATVFVDGEPRNLFGMYAWLDPGTYEICFGAVDGWGAPECQTTAVGAGGTTTVTGTFTEGGTGGIEPAGPTGYLRVTTSPAVGAGILVDGVMRNGWGLDWLPIAVGPHTVCFTAVEGFRTPNCQLVVVAEDQTATVVGHFEPLALLRVEVEPAGLPTEILVDGIATNQFGIYVWREPNPWWSTEVCFTPVAGYITPACVLTDLVGGEESVVSGLFLPEP